jgi:hypothetical protein
VTNEVSAVEPEPAAEVIAARLQQSARGGTEGWPQALQELARLDRELYAAIALGKDRPKEDDAAASRLPEDTTTEESHA